MKVNTRQIGPKGLEVRESFPPESMDLIQEERAKLLAPVDVKAILTRVDDKILAEVTANSRFEASCGRCLEQLTRDWTKQLVLYFEADPGVEFIEIGEDIREEIMVSFPWSFLCSEECKGLCVDCGVNLNCQSCDHNHAVERPMS